jgi:hypothetical protein
VDILILVGGKFNNMVSFESKLRELINSCSKENDNDTPDYILAEYLSHCLDAYTLAVRQRDNHYKAMVPRVKANEPLVTVTPSHPKTQAQTMVKGMSSMNEILQTMNKPVTNPWISVSERLPEYGKKVEVKMSDGLYKFAKYDKDVNRTCWMILGIGGLYWRSLRETVEEWREFKE